MSGEQRAKRNGNWWVTKDSLVGRRRRLVLFTLSVLAGAIHFWVMPEHFAEWWGYGSFFAVVGALQVVYGAMWLRLWLNPSLGRGLAVAGIVAHLALFGLYIVTRTLGIPFFGPHAWEIEPVGSIDLFSKLVESMLLGALVLVLRDAGGHVSRIDPRI